MRIRAALQGYDLSEEFTWGGFWCEGEYDSSTTTYTLRKHFQLIPIHFAFVAVRFCVRDVDTEIELGDWTLEVDAPSSLPKWTALQGERMQRKYQGRDDESWVGQAYVGSDLEVSSTWWWENGWHYRHESDPVLYFYIPISEATPCTYRIKFRTRGHYPVSRDFTTFSMGDGKEFLATAYLARVGSDGDSESVGSGRARGRVEMGEIAATVVPGFLE